MDADIVIGEIELMGDTLLIEAGHDLQEDSSEESMTTATHEEAAFPTEIDISPYDIEFLTGFVMMEPIKSETPPSVTLLEDTADKSESTLEEFERDTPRKEVPVNPPHEPVSITLYPNPSAERLFVLSSDNGRTDIVVIDSNGRTVLSAVTTGELSQIDVTNLDNGTYILRYLHTSTPISKRFIVKR